MTVWVFYESCACPCHPNMELHEHYGHGLFCQMCVSPCYRTWAVISRGLSCSGIPVVEVWLQMAAGGVRYDSWKFMKWQSWCRMNSPGFAPSCCWLYAPEMWNGWRSESNVECGLIMSNMSNVQWSNSNIVTEFHTTEEGYLPWCQVWSPWLSSIL